MAVSALILASAVTPAAARWGGGWHGGEWRGAGIAAGIGAGLALGAAGAYGAYPYYGYGYDYPYTGRTDMAIAACSGFGGMTAGTCAVNADVSLNDGRELRPSLWSVAVARHCATATPNLIPASDRKWRNLWNRCPAR